MNNLTPCFCGSNKAFSDCCEPIIQGKTLATTAEQLMRSRYSAYAIVEPAYLMRSTYASQQQFHNEADIKAWALANKWQKLAIIVCEKGQSQDTTGEVEFKAFYIDSAGRSQVHHEKSIFIKEAGQWFYVSGITVPISLNKFQNRNDSCACGSGKKFKKCCGATK